MPRFFWRPLRPGESDPELLWGAVLAASALLGVGWLLIGLPTPLCPLHALTGIPCPTCGMTRGIACLLQGRIIEGFLFNPLLIAGLLGAAIYVLYAAVVVIGRLPRLRCGPLSPAGLRFLRIGLVAAVALDWAYQLWREGTFF